VRQGSDCPTLTWVGHPSFFLSNSTGGVVGGGGGGVQSSVCTLGYSNLHGYRGESATLLRVKSGLPFPKVKCSPCIFPGRRSQWKTLLHKSHPRVNAPKPHSKRQPRRDAYLVPRTKCGQECQILPKLGCPAVAHAR
jgi:hypothetical protein